jgi:hypothetical protein
VTVSRNVVFRGLIVGDQAVGFYVAPPASSASTAKRFGSLTISGDQSSVAGNDGWTIGDVCNLFDWSSLKGCSGATGTTNNNAHVDMSNLGSGLGIDFTRFWSTGAVTIADGNAQTNGEHHH